MDFDLDLRFETTNKEVRASKTETSRATKLVSINLKFIILFSRW